MTHQLQFLWATPRTVSTAFERMMIERGDHLVRDEPFSAAYYLSAVKRSDRFDELVDDSDPGQICAELLAAAETGDLFVKDMAYQGAPWVDDAFLARCTNTFLIRDPAWALPSFARRWPDITEDEAGYRAQAELFDRARAIGDVVVIDSDDLRADPVAVVEAWSHAVGIDFRPDSLSWRPGMQPEWTRWRDWYEAAASSTGFEPVSPGAPPRVDSARLATMIEEARSSYSSMYALRLRT